MQNAAQQVCQSGEPEKWEAKHPLLGLLDDVYVYAGLAVVIGAVLYAYAAYVGFSGR